MGTHTYQVLVVDDDKDTLKLIKIMLYNTPFSMVTATNGQEALKKAHSSEFDIVILDIMMPDMSGVTVCGYMRSIPHLRNIPIVMLTALDDYATRRKATHAGATDLMTKPVIKRDLLAKLHGVLAEHHARSDNTEAVS